MAGCTGSSPAPASTTTVAYVPFTPNATPTCQNMPPGVTATETFDGTAPGWTTAKGTWTAQVNETAKSATKVMRGISLRETSADKVSVLVACPLGKYTNLDLTVWLRNVEPDDGLSAGAGIVIHYNDPTNMQIIRFSPREAGWHIFTWTPDAPRVKQNEASIATGIFHEDDEWIQLRVVSANGHITAYDAGTPVLQYELPAGHSGVGAVGLFLRAAADSDTTADFDDFHVAPI